MINLIDSLMHCRSI